MVDLGAGEGRDSVFLAKEGFDVLAVDIAPAGLEKARKLADEMKIKIKTKEADLNDLVLTEAFDVVYSIGTLQYITPVNRDLRFKHIKEMTSPGGLNVMFAFIEHPEVEMAPDWGRNEYLFKRHEFQGYFQDWEILDAYEFIFDYKSGQVPHRHAASVVIAKKPAKT